MYALVNDVDRYAEFLRWCAHGAVLDAGEGHVLASLVLNIGGLEHKLTTRNDLVPDERIVMRLVDGPFRALGGEWRFQPLGDHGCRVSLHLDFEFRSSLLSAAFQGGFAALANHMVDEFVARADAIYG